MATQNKGAQFKIDWKILNFDDFPRKKGQLLSSPTFIIDTLHRSQWVLHLYPDGDNDGNGEFTALYLVRKPDDDYPESILLHCQLSFVTPKEKGNVAEVSWKTTNHTFQRGGRCGSQEFLDEEKLLTYLENNTLAVSCVVYLDDVDASMSGGCEAKSMIGTDERSFEWVIEDFQDMQPGDKKVMPIKSVAKDALSMTMTLSMTSDETLMVDISPVDGKIFKRASCYLFGEGIDRGFHYAWFDEIKDEQILNFPLKLSKEKLLENQINSSLQLECDFTFYIGIEFEKIQKTYFRPLTDSSSKKVEPCNIM